MSLVAGTAGPRPSNLLIMRIFCSARDILLIKIVEAAKCPADDGWGQVLTAVEE